MKKMIILKAYYVQRSKLDVLLLPDLRSSKACKVDGVLHVQRADTQTH